MHVDCEQRHASFAVSDVAAAIEFYTTKLGFRVAFTEGDPPTFAGVNLGDVQIFLRRRGVRSSGLRLVLQHEACEARAVDSARRRPTVTNSPPS
jgi:catechol 2,3-dioxygenase-like lactoylglutathione lyase family enzyme